MLFGRKTAVCWAALPRRSLFDAAGLPQRYFVVSVQPLLSGRLRAACSHRDFPVSKAVQSRCLNGLRAQLRFLCKRYLRHIRLDAAARSSRCAGYGFRFVSAHRHCVGDAEWKISLHPGKTRMNGNLAVYGASGSMKTRSFCMNRILQSAARGESLIICDPKSNSTKNPANICGIWGYTVRVFNLVSPENSDSWNCLKEMRGRN